jgi:diacylglycerol O-acyltransferase / wax synthase
MPLMSAQDAAFVMAEARERPMHVAGLMIFKIPDGSPDDYVSNFHRELLAQDSPIKALMRRHPMEPVSYAGRLAFTDDDEVDLRHHLRLTALPGPGTDEQLMDFVAHAHPPLLDRHIPMWQLILIDGLEGNRFAAYFKIHHSLIDGMGSMALLVGSMTTDPEGQAKPFWIDVPEKHPATSDTEGPSGGFFNPIPRLVGTLGTARDAVVNATRLSARAGEVALGRREGPGLAPKTSLNSTITGARELAAGSWDLGRLRGVSKALGVSFNDLVLAMSASALRDLLAAAGSLPTTPLIACVPVSLAPGGGDSNMIGAVLTSLATDEEDPLRRLARIHDSMNTAKETGAILPADQFQLAGTAIMGTPTLLGRAPLATAVPPLYNVLISNVPGPRVPMYWNGARMEHIYPMSALPEGQGMNITVLSYNGQMQFGVLACPRTVPRYRDMIDGFERGLAELEAGA